jgi:hypothetical protein
MRSKALPAFVIAAFEMALIAGTGYSLEKASRADVTPALSF